MKMCIKIFHPPIFAANSKLYPINSVITIGNKRNECHCRGM
ncbi:hypothetical protein CBC_0486 [Clostridium botulinum C str. Eklund]|nr:hypothetical protein CBC_0486 [Clostridium botulinum C str. Eklund]